jgi:hypothetical protein
MENLWNKRNNFFERRNKLLYLREQLRISHRAWDKKYYLKKKNIRIKRKIKKKCNTYTCPILETEKSEGFHQEKRKIHENPAHIT